MRPRAIRNYAKPNLRQLHHLCHPRHLTSPQLLANPANIIGDVPCTAKIHP